MNIGELVPVITIDGPGGTGKGTLCHALAHYLQWHWLDSGAIYRAFALAAHQLSLKSQQVAELVDLAHKLNLKFEVLSNRTNRILLNGGDVGAMIRTEECGQWASQFAAIAEVRQALLERQRRFAVEPGLVTDGRDMGTVVFPNAFLKIFLTASVEERAKRRLLQLQAQQIDVSLAQVVEELTKRDERDENRQASPMRAAEDAVLVDTTAKSIHEVLDEILALVNDRLKRSH